MPKRIEKLGPWLRPVLLAPWLSMAVCITVGVTVAWVLGQLDPKFGPLQTWVLGIMAGSIGTVLISSALIATDLMRAKLGTLPPEGIRAWASGGLAFAITLGLYLVFLPLVDGGFLFGEAIDFCVMVLGSVAVGAISARLVFSRWGILLVIVLALLSAPFVFRALRIAGLPDIDDPFDVEEFGTVEVDAEDNAFTLYRDASGLLVKSSGLDVNDSKKAFEEGWSAASEGVRTWVADNRPAMDVWRKGTERREAVYHQPKDFRIDMLLPLVQDLRDFARLAKLEGSRLEMEGKPAEAWRWYRAIFRSSRHSGLHGVVVERLIGSSLHATAIESIDKWASNPDVDADMLRKAIANVTTDYKMTAPTSTGFKAEYIIVMKLFDDPDQASQLTKMSTFGTIDPGPVGLFFKNEPELSRRVTKHVLANLLAQIDKPPQARTKRHSGRLTLYDPDPGDKESSLPVEEIEQYFNQSVFALVLLPGIEPHEEAIRREQAKQACLIVMLAAQRYHRDHGRFPEEIEDLLDGYLLNLPTDPHGKAGETIRYRRGDIGASAWSVGQNGIDDGGELTGKQSRTQPPDIGLDFAAPGR